MAPPFYRPSGDFSELETIAQWINIASLATCSFVAVNFTLVFITRRHLVDRFSGRMILRFCIADALVAVSSLLSGKFTTTPGCTIFNGLGQFGTLISTLLTVVLVNNLRVVLVGGKRNAPSHERVYVIISILISLLVTLPPTAFGWVNGVCVGYEVISSFPMNLVSIYLTYFLWIAVAIIYSIVAIPLILMRRRKRSRLLPVTNASSDSLKLGLIEKSSKGSLSIAEQEIRGTVRRGICYACALLVTQLPALIFVTLHAISIYAPEPKPLIYIMYTTTPMLGLLHFIIFLFDPIFRYTFPFRNKESLGEQAWLLVGDVASLEMPSADSMQVMKLI
ncbi:hypothetical protein K7432_001064 [Basidiobolus ranarum]|uniref:G protein-coupled receptor n=1 Tax=Basidiobolus ranarum TaxID=34480 RepID=A0ABR2WA80_9FUNG